MTDIGYDDALRLLLAMIGTQVRVIVIAEGGPLALLSGRLSSGRSDLLPESLTDGIAEAIAFTLEHDDDSPPEVVVLPRSLFSGGCQWDDPMDGFTVSLGATQMQFAPLEPDTSWVRRPLHVPGES